MLVTPQFVLLNYPKTGSTFVRSVIKQIYRSREATNEKSVSATDRGPDPNCRELLMPNIKVTPNGPPDQHGTYIQIPKCYRDKTIVSVARNPFDRIISIFRFGWHQRDSLRMPESVIKKHLPNFPDLSFREFLDFSQLHMRYSRFGGSLPNATVGDQTIQFIQMFFREPKRILRTLDDKYLDSDKVFGDMAPVFFLRQESLNTDLAEFLAERGYAGHEVSFAFHLERVNVTQPTEHDLNNMWTEDLIELTRQRERMLLQIYEKLGFNYGLPSI